MSPIWGDKGGDKMKTATIEKTKVKINFRLRDIRGRFIPTSVSAIHKMLRLPEEKFVVIHPTKSDPIYVGIKTGVKIGRI